MTWKGEVVISNADSASLNIDGVGTQDLSVDFLDINAGYNLEKGEIVSETFIMKNMGGCFLPFSGEDASY